ncbi:MAG: YceI family protein [Bacteroidota bacterium]
MKRIFFLFGITALLFSCNAKNAEQAKSGEAQQVNEASGSEFSLDSNTSKIMWRGAKVGGEHHGIVNAKSGNIMVEDGNLTGGTIVIDLNSIENHDLKGDMNARLVGHLKSEDFFYTEEYPEAVFEIVSVKEYTGDATESEIDPTHEITGNLTMRGVTKSITFPAMVSVDGNKVSASTNEFAIDRTLWGVNFKSKSVFAEFKDDYINDMINLKFDVKFAGM